MMWTFQAPLTKSNSFAPGQSCWGSPRPNPQWRCATRPPITQQQVIRSGVLTERYGRPASSSPRPCYSWRSRAVEPHSTPGSLCVPPGKSPEGRLGPSRPSPGPVPRHEGRQSSVPRRPAGPAVNGCGLKSVTRARTPPLHTRERNRQKLETATQEQQRSEEARYEKYLQPENFSVPDKGFVVSRIPFQVHQSQPPPSLTNSASTISPAMTHRHRPSDAHMSQDEVSHVNSPSTVPQAFSDTSGSPDKENNNPDLQGSGMVWEDPGSSSARSARSPGSARQSSASSLKGASPRQVLQDRSLQDASDNINASQMKPEASPKPRRKSAAPLERSMEEAPRRKSQGDRHEVCQRLGDCNQSLVQEKISLWETMSGASGRAAKMSTSTTGSQTGSQAGSRGRSSGVSNCSWYRSFSDMARNMRQESAQMSRLMDRLREVGYDELGSPFSTHSTEASSPGEDLTDSPETQKIKAQLVDMNRHMKLTKKMYRAMDGLLRMHSLDQAFANADGQCKSTSLSLSTSPSPRHFAEPSGRKTDGKADEDTTACEIDSSRNSSNRSSQVQDSPRYSVPNWMRPDLAVKPQDDTHSADGDAEGHGAEEDVATNTSSSPSRTEPSSPEQNVPLPGQEGMPRHETFLYHLEQQELHRQVTLVVPPGMDETRRVNFIFEEQEMTVAIPEGYDVGQQVTVQVPTRKRPPLERNATQAWHRGRQHLPDRHVVMENLRHCCRVTTSISLDHPEYKTRYQLYGMLQGKSMTPMLPEMPEGDEQDALTDVAEEDTMPIPAQD
mmetsp:Transcript_15666/g.37161  ORF Transcript_15666/g.37161 Transcript_15666/m.37161 type:complete len:782 (-) Transcript_15666:242-2587(-)